MPNAVTYHELISGLLKANKEIHRTQCGNCQLDHGANG